VPFDRWTTGRLVLRRPVPQDADALFAIYSHPEVMRYWSRRPLVTRDEAVRMIENMVAGLADGTWQCWAVTFPEDDTPIGVCSLFNFVTGCRRAEIGYILAR